MMSELKVGERLVALLLDLSDLDSGVSAISDTEWPLQVMMMKRKEGYIVEKHAHKNMERTTHARQKAIVVIKGEMSVVVCDEEGTDGEECMVSAGQCLYLVDGGYRIEMKKDCAFYEFKNGPHLEDKISF